MEKIEATVQQIDDWIAALRSGEYEQTRGAISEFPNQFSHSTCTGDSFCCLGVAGITWFKQFKGAADLFHNGLNNEFNIYREMEKLIGKEHKQRCIDLNDTLEASFLEIADYIEKEVRPLCKDYNAN